MCARARANFTLPFGPFCDRLVARFGSNHSGVHWARFVTLNWSHAHLAANRGGANHNYANSDYCYDPSLNPQILVVHFLLRLDYDLLLFVRTDYSYCLATWLAFRSYSVASEQFWKRFVHFQIGGFTHPQTLVLANSKRQISSVRVNPSRVAN